MTFNACVCGFKIKPIDKNFNLVKEDDFLILFA